VAFTEEAFAKADQIAAKVNGQVRGQLHNYRQILYFGQFFICTALYSTKSGKETQ
jgi:hypothetical protein